MEVIKAILESFLHFDAIASVSFPALVEVHHVGSCKSSCLYFLHRLRGRVESNTPMLVGCTSQQLERVVPDDKSP